MVLSDDKKKAYARRLLLSRNRILCSHGFYGMLLMHIRFIIDPSCETAYTDGSVIAFSPEFLDDLDDGELDFVLMHEILHVALQHCTRGSTFDEELFNIACDIVVNSNILKSCGMDIDAITLASFGESMHLTPVEQEGYLFNAEEVYNMLKGQSRPIAFSDDRDNARPDTCEKATKGGRGRGGNGKNEKPKRDDGAVWDDHSKWQVDAADDELKEIWMKRVVDAAAVIAVNDPSNSCGAIPACIERVLMELRKPQNDWRTLLNDFVQEEVCDYSFTPPDRRFSDSDFFLPDYNDTDTKVEDVLFMVDTSGSISDEMLSASYSEIKGAIDQFNGKLCGWLGFFDAEVYEPLPFESVSDVLAIRPKGGGGTDFGVIFDYVFRKLEKLPASIIILTDGFADFPPEEVARSIPVLWMINNKDVDPPWGRVARIEV